MGFHCDNTFNLSGKYLECSSSQIRKTPIVIVSFGNDKVLHWKNYMPNNRPKENWSG